MRARAVLCLLLLACDAKQASRPATDVASANIDRELSELQRLEFEHQEQQRRVAQLDAGPGSSLVSRELGYEGEVLLRARKTLVTARTLAAIEARARVEKAMAEARAARVSSNASWTALQAGLERQAIEAEKTARNAAPE